MLRIGLVMICATLLMPTKFKLNWVGNLMSLLNQVYVKQLLGMSIVVKVVDSNIVAATSVLERFLQIKR
ncbi:hypothetical protein AYI75_04195 [Shewanella algae]|nr:hypothetical protein AYI75_04195 [Shewanella algae]